MSQQEYDSVSIKFFPLSQNNVPQEKGRLSEIEMTCDLKIEDNTKWHKFSFKTLDKNIFSLYNTDKWRIEIPLHYVNGDLLKTVTLENCRISDLGHYTSGLNEHYKFTAHPSETVIRRKKYDTKTNKKTKINFHINPANLVSPNIKHSFEQDGGIKQTKNQPIVIDLMDKGKVLLDAKFVASGTSNNITLKKTQLYTLEVEDECLTIGDIKDNLLEEIDLLNDIISFIHDKKIFCSKWTLDTSNELTTVYRHFNIKTTNTSGDKAILTPPEVNKSLNKIFHNYKKSIYKQNIKLAINTLILQEQYLEPYYLSLFQAYESITLTYKKNKTTQYIIPENEFKTLRKKIENFLSPDILEDKDIRSKIKGKLSELNRTSLRDVVNSFEAELNNKNDDLWPIFRDKNGIGLADIRNAIIHGELIEDSNMTSIIIACEHLKIHLARLVLTLLSQKIESTSYSEQDINMRTKLNEFSFWSEYRNSLTKALL
ncbi:MULTISPECIES: hypothetical protein [Enterobacter]|uniref:hypothetical protein n=1 Tax=Enterobacter TaxID=547 RepID=UPI00073CDB0B|nr:MULTISPECIES: hypothetical protein [Enterobacter]EKS6929046.1 hypothetical protein [Enterobacter bugandensis]EKV5172056.1 hypothetical protein [Enterobacter bugandensis]KSX61356.1 hypothetical protein APT89_14475 [Enterobacter sp. 50588862]MDX7473788.1 hypothetical protein [Enterobacter bugandensis]